MLCRDGTVSLVCFIVASVISLLPEFLSKLELDIYASYFTSVWLLHAVQYIVINVFAFLVYRDFSYQVSISVILSNIYFTYNFLYSRHFFSRWQSERCSSDMCLELVSWCRSLLHHHGRCLAFT